MEKRKNENRNLYTISYQMSTCSSCGGAFADCTKNQIKYPAPYSQSWSAMDPMTSILSEKNLSRTVFATDNISKKHSGGISSSAQSSDTSQRFTRQDPTLPHLKYNVSPEKVYISRGQSRILTIKPSARISSQARRIGSPKRPHCIVEPRRLNIERLTNTKASTVQKFLHNHPNAQGESSGPVFVFRPLAPRHLSSLTVSASAHLDIRPRPQRPVSQHYTRYL